ncbi:MAG: redox-sensing transcriptional repressor Rex [Planctomycetia bacterium]|nr:redox-sensing transcriptional repressor Rex [Planctomycetia bacterium]
MSDSRPTCGEPPSDITVPKVVVSRLSLYLRELQRLQSAGQQTISSGQLGTLLGFSDAQVRKDLGFFGQFGYPGVGYRCDELIRAMRDILGTYQFWPVVMVGAGNLGQALLGYRGFGRQNFAIHAAFDADPAKVGQTIQGIPVLPLSDLPRIVKDHGIRLGMIVVPAEQAQVVADRLVAAGIEGIVNFAPVTLSLPPNVQLVSVDLAIELEQLSFAITNRLARPAEVAAGGAGDGADTNGDSVSPVGPVPPGGPVQPPERHIPEPPARHG